jgi:hypothetical protein
MTGEPRDDVEDGRSDDEKLIDRHLAMLMEHFDAVQIFCTRNVPDASEPGGGGVTFNFARGLGNWFSRYGHVVDWLTKQDQRSRNEITKQDAESEADGI